MPSPAPEPTPAPTPTGPSVPVAGPLVVLSERVGAAEAAGAKGITTQRIVFYDVGQRTYWTAFEYRDVYDRKSDTSLSAVQPAGTSLIVWTEDQVRRVTLNGYPETVLLEHSSIREIEVSPDGTRVAIVVLHGQTLLVLDTATGEEQLRVSRGDSQLKSLGGKYLEIGNWHADGQALSVTNGEYRPHTAIVTLDGDIRVLQDESVVSPDFRHALRFGIRYGPEKYQERISSVAVLDTETGETLWTISNYEGVIPAGGIFSRWQSRAWWQGDSRYVAFSLADGEGARLLDVETGETLTLTPELEQRIAPLVQSTCDIIADREVEPLPCDVIQDGRVAWEGTRGRTHYLGLIDVPAGFALRGIELLEVPEEPVPVIPPPWEPVKGPFLLFEVHSTNATQPRLLLWHEAGRGNTWQLDRRPGEYACPPQLARDGLVICDGGTLSYLPWDGETKVLIEGAECRSFRVSPDGTKVAVSVCGEIFVFELPSGEQILHFDRDELDYYARLNDWGVNGWSADGTLLSITFHGPCCWAAAGAIRISDGEILERPGDFDIESANLAPDARHVVRGRTGVPGEYSAWDWRGFDVIDFETDRVLWSVETSGSLRNDHWEWASADHFAWSDGADGSGVFLFESQRPAQDAERAEVSVLDVNTGEIEVLDSADYLARFHPPSRATTECPENPGRPCKILLDGEVIGEGRWPRIIGFIEVE